MKVNIDQTLQVSDEQRVQIANVLDGRVTKRQATRDEMKDYLWTKGKDWENLLNEDFLGLTGDDSTVDETEADEDLLGASYTEDDEPDDGDTEWADDEINAEDLI